MIIRITDSAGKPKDFEFEVDAVSIGRGDHCDVVVSDDRISRKHMEVRHSGGLVYIRDLSPANWISNEGEKLPKDKEVRYSDSATVLLPGGYTIEIESGAKRMKS